MGGPKKDFIEANLDVLRRVFSLERAAGGDDDHAAAQRGEVAADLRTLDGRWDLEDLGPLSAVPDLAALAKAVEAGSAGPPTIDQVASFAIELVALAHRAAVSGGQALGPGDQLDLPDNAWWRRVARRGFAWSQRGLAVHTVIHVSGEAQALEQSDLALSCGADGVFLINHAMGVDELLDVYGAVREAVGVEAFVGINPLGGDPVEVVRDAIGRGFASMFDALWVDNAGIDETSVEQPSTHRTLRDLWDGCYFGGVAFKYQRSVDDLGGAARAAAGQLDVLTTSGSGTGSAPSADKIEALADAAPGVPVAIASGITPENVSDIARYADAVLVATGISRDFEHLDPERVRALVRAASALR